MIATTKETKNEYKVYDYFKKHPGILISIISAFTVIITFIFQMVIYFRTCRYLDYWGMNPQYVEISNPNQIYYLTVSCVYYFVNTFVQLFLLSTYDKYLSEMDIFIYVREMEKDYCKKIRESKKEVKKIRREIKRNKQKKSKLQKQVTEFENDRENNEQGYKTIRGIKKKVKQDCIKRLLPSVIIAILVMYSCFYGLLLITKYSLDSKEMCIASGITTLILAIVPWVVVYITHYIQKRKQLKKMWRMKKRKLRIFLK